MNRKKNIKIGVSNKEGQLGFMFERGGLRAGAGRKRIGETKKCSLTLSEETWEQIENVCVSQQASRSEVLRGIIESYFNTDVK